MISDAKEFRNFKEYKKFLKTSLKRLKKLQTVKNSKDDPGGASQPNETRTVGEQLKKVVQAALAPKKAEGLVDVKGLTVDEVPANDWLKKTFKDYMVSD